MINEGIKECLKKAKESGYYAEKKDEEVNLVDTIVTLYKLLSSKEDLFMLLWVMFLLSISFYLDLESQLLTGQVMGILPTVFLNKDNNRTFFFTFTCLAHGFPTTNSESRTFSRN
jgi:hypothetical protein